MADRPDEIRIAVELITAWRDMDMDAVRADPAARWQAHARIERIRTQQSDDVVISSLFLFAGELLDTIAGRDLLPEPGEPTAAAIRERGQRILADLTERYPHP